MTKSIKLSMSDNLLNESQVINASLVDSELSDFLWKSERNSIKVQSVFHRACNLLLENGQMITLLDAEFGFAPSTISVKLMDGFSFMDSGIRVGQSVARKQNILEFTELLQINFSEARAINCFCKPIDTLSIGLSERLDYAASIFRLAIQKNGFAQLFEIPGLSPAEIAKISDLTLKAAIPAIKNLLEATAEGEIEKIVKSADSLLGLGIGLTPSGDDFLLGYIAISHLTQNFSRPSLNDYREVLATCLRMNAYKTTAVSVNYLQYAISGRLSEKLSKFCNALLCGDDLQVRKTSLDMQKIGATSGFDMAAGVIKTLQILTTLKA